MGVIRAGIVLFALILASACEACPMCQLGRNGTLQAYIGPTVLLSAVPVGIIGGIAVWLRRARARSRDGVPKI